jgi:hypothetical protein
MLKITTKSQIETRLPEQIQYRITNAHCYSVRPNIAKPRFGGSIIFWTQCLQYYLQLHLFHLVYLSG